MLTHEGPAAAVSVVTFADAIGVAPGSRRARSLADVHTHVCFRVGAERAARGFGARWPFEGLVPRYSY